MCRLARVCRRRSDPAFSTLSPDDGNGSWSYVENATQCHIFFFQGTVTDLDLSQEDRAISDGFLTVMLSGRLEGVTQADVTANAFDDTIWQADLASTEEVRTIWGTATDESAWMGSARMVGELGGGVYTAVTCPPEQDVIAEHDKLFNGYLTILVTPS